MFKHYNTVIPFQLGNNLVRGSIVRLTTAVSNIINLHNYPSIINSLLADALTLTSCVGSRMKHKGIFTIQARGNGNVNTVFSDITNDGNLRGFIEFNKNSLYDEQQSLLELMGSGNIAFTLDQGDFLKRYQGIVSLDKINFAKSTEHYFNNSEQLKTMFLTANAYSSLVSEDNQDKFFTSGLVMLQKMPNKNDILYKSETEDAWDTSCQFLSTLKQEELLSKSLTSNDLLIRLFHEIGVTVYDEIQIKDQCRCSDKKVRNAFEDMKTESLKHLLNEDGFIIVVCEFCKKERKFTNKMFIKI